MRLRVKTFEVSYKKPAYGERSEIFITHDLRKMYTLSHFQLANTVMAGAHTNTAYLRGGDLYKGRSLFTIPSYDTYLKYVCCMGYTKGAFR